MSLNYTPLRHRMLAKIRDGEVCRGLGVDGWGIRGVLPSKRGICERTVDSLVGPCAQIPAGARYDTPLELTQAGATTYWRWTSQHGEPR